MFKMTFTWPVRVLMGVAAVIVVMMFAAAVQVGRYQALHTELEIIIAQPPEVVWPYLTESDKRAQWVQGLVDLIPLSGVPGQLGARHLMVMQLEGQRYEVVENLVRFESGRLLVSRIDRPSYVSTTSFRLIKDADRTRLMVVQDSDHESFFGRLFAPWAHRAAIKKMTADIAKLKIVIETRHAPGQRADTASRGAESALDETTDRAAPETMPRMPPALLSIVPAPPARLITPPLGVIDPIEAIVSEY